ncbi:MAG TPA: hypothetical protein VIF82_16845 [Burkholderiaceae bacterium]|jgi:hypothetical protein
MYYLINLAIAAVIGYSVAFFVATAKLRRGTRSVFVKEAGRDLMVLTLAAIPSAALTSFFIWLVLHFVLTTVGVKLDEEGKLMLFASIYVVVFVSVIFYCVKKLTDERS